MKALLLGNQEIVIEDISSEMEHMCGNGCMYLEFWCKRASIFMSRTFSSLSGFFCFQQLRRRNEGRESARMGRIQARDVCVLLLKRKINTRKATVLKCLWGRSEKQMESKRLVTKAG